MSDAYRPGQLYKGREGDLLFVVADAQGIALITNRGTRVSLTEAGRVYAPLTLVRPVGGEAPEPVTPAVRELAAAVVDAFTVPDPDGPAAWVVHAETLAGRAAHVRGAMCALTADGVRPVHVVTSIRRAGEEFPVTYPTRDEQDAGGDL